VETGQEMKPKMDNSGEEEETEPTEAGISRYRRKERNRVVAAKQR
jgi:hypothetical protein